MLFSMGDLITRYLETSEGWILFVWSVLGGLSRLEVESSEHISCCDHTQQNPPGPNLGAAPLLFQA